MSKLEKERSSHNESREFLKRLLQVKNPIGTHTNDLNSLRFGRLSMSKEDKLSYSQKKKQYKKMINAHQRTASGGVFMTKNGDYKYKQFEGQTQYEMSVPGYDTPLNELFFILKLIEPTEV